MNIKKTRVWWIVLLIGVLTLACSLPQALPRGAATQQSASPSASGAGAEATETQVPAPTAVPQPTSTPKSTEPPPNLEVSQVYLRYDSQEPEGTFEATLCNVGPYPFEGALEVTFEVNGVTSTVRVPGEQEWLVGQCRDVHADKGFSAFGITQPGEVAVTVQFGVAGGASSASQVYQEQMTIRYLATGPTEEALQRYQECMEKYGSYFPDQHQMCVDRLPDFPRAEHDEIAKRWGIYTVIAPREYEDLLSPWLLVLRTCTPEVQRLLALAPDFEVPFLVARLDNEVQLRGHTRGATIFISSESRDNEALMEMRRFGCQLNRLHSLDTSSLLHELTHALIALYVEDEWHGYFYGYLFDDGTSLEGEYPDVVDLLPSALDEGLAYWVEHKFYAEPGILDLECGPGKMRDRNTQTTLDYMPLDLKYVDETERWAQQHSPNGSVPEALNGLLDPNYFWLMASAECFWDWLVTLEGHEVIGKVLTQLRTYPRKDVCDYPFVDVALAPVVSENTLQLLMRLFHMRRDVKACDYT